MVGIAVSDMQAAGPGRLMESVKVLRRQGDRVHIIIDAQEFHLGVTGQSH
jgi:hypothetical protein